MSEIDKPHTPEQIIAFMSQGEFRSEPGEEFIYCNTGYTITVALIEKLSNMNFSQFLQQRLFRPLAMTATYVPDIMNDGSNAVHRYEKEESGYKPAVQIHLSNLIGGGNIITTVADMALWGAALISGKCLPHNLAKLWTPVLLSNNKSTDYGLGIGIEEFEGRKIYYHPGQGSGMDSFAVIFPEEQLYIIVIRNMANPLNSSQDIAFKVAECILGNPA